MKLPRDEAFTLVEMLAALAFLGILMPVVVSALLVASRAGTVAERAAIATQLCENRLNELMLADAWTTENARGDFGAEWPNYRWELTKTDWASGAMTELGLTVFYKVQGNEHEVRLSTLVSETLSAGL